MKDGLVKHVRCAKVCPYCQAKTTLTDCYTQPKHGSIESFVCCSSILRFGNVCTLCRWCETGDEPKLDALQSLMQKQIEILEMGCMVHARYCPPDLKPLQARLEEQLEKMKKQAKTGTGLERRSSTSSSQSLKVDESGTAGSPVPGGTTPHGQKLPPRGASVRNSAANPKNPFGPK